MMSLIGSLVYGSVESGHTEDRWLVDSLVLPRLLGIAQYLVMASWDGMDSSKRPQRRQRQKQCGWGGFGNQPQ